MGIPKDFVYMVECNKCPLHKTRKHVVVGTGPTRKVKWMFVGEAPGQTEDESGLPFAGKAGEELNDIFEEVGINREEVYITNIVKCRPPDNRKPTTREVSTCTMHLILQVRKINPEIIVAVGNTALAYFVSSKERISKCRGKLLKSRMVRQPIYPIIHPAAVFRTPEYRDMIVEDLRKLVENNIQKDIQIGIRIVE